MSLALFDFPELCEAYPLEERIKEEMVSFSFHLCRPTAVLEWDHKLAIENSFRGLFRLVSLVSLDARREFYLNLLERITVLCRDIGGGKGEREISYVLAFVWFELYPATFERIFSSFVHGCGGWRDAVGIAEYAHLRGGGSGGDSTFGVVVGPLVRFCVRQINVQLDADLRGGTTGDRISYVAKWIPRENKKNGWMFPLLVEDWAQQRGWDTVSYSQQCKSYRKLCSRLNRALSTYETLVPDANPESSRSKGIGVFSKYSRKDIIPIFDGDGDGDEEKRERRRYYCSDHGKFVAELFRIYEQNGSGASYGLDAANRVFKRAFGINAVWKRDMDYMRQKWNRREHRTRDRNILVVLDTAIGAKMNAAIGLACGLAALSTIRRILTVGHLPSWISFPESAEFSDMVCSVYQNIGVGVGASAGVDATFRLLTESLAATEPSEREDITVVYISNMASSSSSIHTKYGHMLPHIVYWGIGVDWTTPLPCRYNTKNASIVSGESIELIYSDFMICLNAALTEVSEGRRGLGS